MFSFLSISTFLCLAQVITAQTFGFNGQIFTRGLAIIDSPAPQSTLHAGSNVAIAVDISGDGNLPASAATPGSNDSTRFDSLEIYLFSYPQSINLTISSGSDILAQENSSTVKHINYNISSCVPAGQYNLSFYEVSHINNQEYFIISAIPVEVQNDNKQGGCNSTNALATFPEPDNAPTQSPWLNSTAGATSIAPNLPSPTPTGGDQSGAMVACVEVIGLIAGLMPAVYFLLGFST
ncbi:unnamed protein product [Somion occarium]|uniref:Uncharacterized protein n=1 Tax=Somion occarium TaxID=3059160 RepID=A0ABP1DCN2_9APHY